MNTTDDSTPNNITAEQIEELLYSTWEDIKNHIDPIEIYHGWSGPENDPERYWAFSAKIPGSEGQYLLTGICGFKRAWEQIGYLYPIKYNGILMSVEDLEKLKEYVTNSCNKER